MIKLSANISKKLPIPGLEYSSQQFGASMEIEISDADKPEVIQGRIQELYGLLSNSIDAQITGTTQQPAPALPAPARTQPAQSQPPVQQPVQQRPTYAPGRNRVAAVTNGNGNGRRINATEAQVKCIFAICKANGIDMASVLADFNVSDPKDLPIKDASRLIDQLKNGNAAAH